MKTREYLRDFEWHLLLIALVLSALGITFIWSVAQGSPALAGKPLRQALFLACCLPAVGGVLLAGYRAFARAAYGIYGLVLLLLVGVIAVNRGGAARWFDLPFGFRFQPSEFAKLALILALSRYLMYPRNLASWRGAAPAGFMTLLPMGLIVMQPDLGTALVLVPVLGGMLYAAGFPGRRLLFLALAAALLFPAAYFLPLLKDYQRERLRSYLVSIPHLTAEAHTLRRTGRNEEAAALEARIRALKRGAGYQQFYAMAALGGGGLKGCGLAQGPQNRHDMLPARHTDFIFAVVGEEWGFWGCSVMLLLFLLMAAIILGVARRTRDPFGRHLCTGVALLVMTQALVNTAINVGLLPVTGLTLPFVSYGGSSLLSSYLALALVLDVGVRRIPVLGPGV